MRRVFLIICLLCTVGTIQGDELSSDNMRTLLVLPFVNYTHSTEASTLMMDALLHQLDSQKIDYYDMNQLRDIMRENRIRNSGKILYEDAQVLMKSTGKSLAMVGSFDFYNTDNMNEIGLHFRIVDLKTMHIRFVHSAYEVGLLTGQLFKSSEVQDIATVLNRAVKIACKPITDSLLREISTTSISGVAVPVGVIELDNLSPYHHAGKIITNQLLEAFFDLGFTVVEPGVIFEDMLISGVRYRGEIDFTIARTLHRQYNTLLLCTGTVEEFKPGTNIDNLPEIELALRMIDGPSQKIVGMYQETIQGDDYEKLFHLGGCKSIGTLSQRLLNKLITTFRKDRHYDEYTEIMQK